MKAISTRLAEAGYTVFAPDLYHGKIAQTIAEAEALGGALDENHLQAKAEIAQAANYLKERAGLTGSGIAVIAFSLGAYYALHLAATEPETVRAVVLFYGAGPADFSKMNATFLGHFAENDEYEPQSNVEELEQSLREAGRPVTSTPIPAQAIGSLNPTRSKPITKRQRIWRGNERWIS
jgi:carboxymethylenebutenolidase